MTVRIVELGVTFVVAFLVLTVGSFLSLRPHLSEVRAEAASDWKEFRRSVEERNKALPGLAQALRGFEAGHGRLTDNLMATRAVLMHSNDPDGIVAAVEEMNRLLKRVQELALTLPKLNEYPPFAGHWAEVTRSTRRIQEKREVYNKTAKLYNRLLSPFPQSLLVALFGFVKLNDYPVVTKFDM